MKRLMVFFIFVLLLFVSCSRANQEILSLKIFDNDNKFQLIPDYKERTLRVIYEDMEQFPSEGLVGGDYFDRFEQLIDLSMEKDLKLISADNDEEFYVDVSYRTGKEKFVLFEGENLEFAKGFYGDLYELMTVQEPV